jgi:hypothetical protein
MWPAPRLFARQRRRKHASSTIQAVFSVLRGPCRYYMREPVCRNKALDIQCGGGVDTSTMILRVVGGDRKGSLESETVKYGRESHVTRTRKRLRCEGQQQLWTTDPSSRQRERPTSTKPQLSDSNKNLVVSPRWVLYPKIDRPTDLRS